jgi:D-xylose 1-dehydrogenase
MPDAQFATYPSLKGMPVVISGGATGIGEGIVTEFARQGAKVGFVDIQAEAGEKLASSLRDEGHTVEFAESDITDTAKYQATIAAFAERHGPALALVNNAAHDLRHTLAETTPEFFDERIAVNLKHSFFAIQAVAPGMIAAGKGSIVNFGSISWMIMVGGLPVYTAAKAGMHGMSRSLARELGKSGIRVNTLVPGWVMTERQLTHWVGPKELELIEASQALPGHVYPVDIARMVMFLAADDSKMISGQDFIVDGGWAHG